jgi:ABC-2 type transport system permease protein
MPFRCPVDAVRDAYVGSYVGSYATDTLLYGALVAVSFAAPAVTVGTGVFKTSGA